MMLSNCQAVEGNVRYSITNCVVGPLPLRFQSSSMLLSGINVDISSVGVPVATENYPEARIKILAESGGYSRVVARFPATAGYNLKENRLQMVTFHTAKHYPPF